MSDGFTFVPRTRYGPTFTGNVASDEFVVPTTYARFCASTATAFKEGPYPNVTGGFGEQSCHLCHLDNPINAPGGSVELSGVPPIYLAGERYSITVTLSREGLRRGGFEIAARYASGRQKGRQAGVCPNFEGFAAT